MRYGKFNAIKTIVDGHTFPSKAEADRYIELKMMQQAGLISGLELQPKFPLIVNGVKVSTYVGDFRYLETVTMRCVVEDVKGYPTPMFRLKKKLVRAIYGIEIVEV